MRKFIPALLATVAACGLSVTAAQAGSVAYVSKSSSLSPANSCAITTPCTTLADGIAAVDAGGEVIVLDSGNYPESLSITKSVLLSAPQRAIISPPVGQTAFTVSGTAISLSISNFFIDGAGGTASAINFPADGSLFVTNTSIRRFNGATGVIAAIIAKPPSGTQLRVYLTETTLCGNNFGLIADGTANGIVRASVSNALICQAANNGVTATSSGSGSAVILLHESRIQGTGFGIAAAGAGAGILVDDSRIFGNGTGIFASGGAAILSYGNNNLNVNGTDGSFTGSVSLR